MSYLKRLGILVLICVLVIAVYVYKQSKVITACDFVNNGSFSSVDEFMVGMGPNGPVNSTYKINFADGKFYWLEGEVGGGEGPYTCEELNITGDLNQSKIKGEVNPNTKRLFWNGVEYQKVNNY